ncbi:MAG: FKBP-type peptidyl-prolyl cis-trans isomerase [Sphingobacteriales bacterium]
MRSILFTLIILFTVGLAACRKDKNNPDIKTYDQQQIAAYIAANGITGMVKDTSGKDTTGIWYKIITPGTGAAVDYSSEVSYVYTIRTLDGKFSATDTIINHYEGLEGHAGINLPNGIILAVHNILKYKGGKMRVIIPSHLGYGVNGTGSGSSTIANASIGGNQCLDYTIELTDNQDIYDDLVIRNYIKANGLSSYTKITSGVDSGLYYKITTQGTGNLPDISSRFTTNLIGYLMNSTQFINDSGTTTFLFSDVSESIPGVEAGLLMSRNGGGVSLLIPSRLAYGPGGTADIPANSCLRYDITNIVIAQ